MDPQNTTTTPLPSCAFVYDDARILASVDDEDGVVSLHVRTADHAPVATLYLTPAAAHRVIEALTEAVS